MNKITIDDTSYENLYGMLSSTEEDKVVALATINNVNFDSCVSKILLLKKLSGIKYDKWKEHAPKLCTWIKRQKLDPEQQISYQEIFDILLRKKVETHELQFFLDRFGENLFSSIRGVGYEFLSKVEIKLKYDETR
jgi:hypothetical protein